MKRYLRRNRMLLLMLILIILSFNTVSCNKANKTNASKPESTQITENPEPVQPDVTNSESGSTDKLIYDSSKTVEDNIDILNKILKSKYGKTLSISAADDYEKAGPSDWTLILDSARIGIDTSTWKFNYASNSDDSKYMDAILKTFTFFCGEKMGKSLWLLTGDLLDGGAKEKLYGFEHDGGHVTYKNGNTAAYELGNNKTTMYIWLTPSEY